MKQVDLQTVEEILKGRLSTNPKRFESANGIIFTVDSMTDELMNDLSCRGIEFHYLLPDMFYTETVMTVVEFGKIEGIKELKRVA